MNRATDSNCEISEKPTIGVCFVYSLCDPDTGEIRYVGITVKSSLRKRLGQHCAERKPSHKQHWIASLRASGRKPVIELLEKIDFSEDREWKECEKFWISYLKFIGVRLTNNSPGGIGRGVVSDETREKLRAAWVGNDKRKLASAEMARSLSKTESWRKANLEGSRRMVANPAWRLSHAVFLKAQLERPDRPDIIARRSAKLRRPIVQMDKMTLEVVRRFPSLKSACEEFSVTHGAIISAIQRRGTSCGFRWSYEES
jgi:hypothetical protein